MRNAQEVRAYNDGFVSGAVTAAIIALLALIIVL